MADLNECGQVRWRHLTIASGRLNWPVHTAVLCLWSLVSAGVAGAQLHVFDPAEGVNGKLGQLRDEFKKIREGGERDWHYGAYVDVGYLPNLSHPDADQWRSKTTDFKLNSLEANMALAYIRKEANPIGTRWGGEFGVMGGVDSEGLLPQNNPDTISGADTLRHFHRANLSYLFPVGNGLKLTGGLMNSYIGYDSFLAKNNPNYTRGYLLDNVPYFLFGLEALYPVTDTVTLGFYVVNGYDYLTAPNNLPSYGFHAVWEATPALTVVQNLYYGPDQSNTDLRYWRFFSDSIVEWKHDDWLVAASYDIGTEEQAGTPGHPQDVWMSGAVWARRHLQGPWSLAVRPEFYWDPQGLITGAKQLIWALTGTLEYRIRVISKHTVTAKLEYRFDRSTGSGGGFFTGQQISPGVPQLTPNQQLVILGLMWAFDS